MYRATETKDLASLIYCGFGVMVLTLFFLYQLNLEGKNE